MRQEARLSLLLAGERRLDMSIYVEILIRGKMDDLWQKTQEPKLHGRWDLRFSQIDYLPRAAGEAQKFLYTTRIGAGLQIRGEGESTGERDDSSGQRTSALKFWSKDPKSLIRLLPRGTNQFSGGTFIRCGPALFTAHDERGLARRLRSVLCGNL